MYIILVIGMTGQGKSRLVREKLLQGGKPCLVFDINNEYGGKFPLSLPTDVRLPRSRYASADMDMDTFLEVVRIKRGTNVVFEEATGFLQGNVGQKLNKLMINKRHTENNYIFLFHALHFVPPAVLLMTNYIFLFKTNDDEADIKKRHARLLPHFQKVQRMPDKQPLFIEWIKQ